MTNNELCYSIYRVADVITNDKVFMCACESFIVAESIAKTLSRTIWQGHKVGVYCFNEDVPTVSFLKDGK